MKGTQIKIFPTRSHDTVVRNGDGRESLSIREEHLGKTRMEILTNRRKHYVGQLSLGPVEVIDEGYDHGSVRCLRRIPTIGGGTSGK